MKNWTKEEIQFIKEYFNDYPINEIAAEINRPIREVHDKAKSLGIVPDIPEGFKKCIDCNNIKPINDFYKHQSSKDGTNSYCKICDCIRRRNNAILKKIKYKIDRVLEKEQLANQLKKDTENVYFECSSCGQKKLGTEFYFDSYKLKRFNKCIVCYLEKQKNKKLELVLERGY